VDKKNDAASQAQDHEFAEVVPLEEPSELHLALEDLSKVSLTITAELGKCVMPVREVLELKRGSVVALDKQAGEMTDICVNGLPLARGEIVVIGDTLHVRIGEVTGAMEPEGERGTDSEDAAEGEDLS
jgi:flagellar motor switch protein FliN/FliY